MKRKHLDYKEIVRRIFSLYEGKTQAEIGMVVGKSNHLVGKWGIKSNPTLEDLMKIAIHRGCSVDWLLTGKSAATPDVSLAAEEIRLAADPDALPAGAIRMTTAGAYWSSPEAQAAADTSAQTRTAEVDGMREPIRPPKDTVLIPVHGRSMEPVLLDNQYAVVDWADGGWKGDGGIYVVEIRDGEEADPELFVKHCFLRGENYVLQSVNPDGGSYTFPVNHVNRMWQVIGTWYMGHGKPGTFRAAEQTPVDRRNPSCPAVAGESNNPFDSSPPLLEIYRSILILQKTLVDIGHEVTLNPKVARSEWNAIQSTLDAASDLHKRLIGSGGDPYNAPHTA